ncbi:hypothetical protein ULG90_12080 [Halopseudomonas pachastrellae]|nr:hypothetical protein ULG90_12080 [Halopseudomonas pachastrellae]
MSYHHNDTDLSDGYDLNMWQHNGLGTTIGDTWTLSADYRFSESLEMGWQGRFVEQVSVDTLVGEIDKAGYGVQDVYANWMVLDDERLTLSLTVKNLFDKQYLDHASNGDDFEAIPGYEGVIGAYEPGRKFVWAWRCGSRCLPLRKTANPGGLAVSLGASGCMP